MAALAPSSPRLPSPPPPAEIQIGPKSPSMGSVSTRHASQLEQTALDANSKRRIHPGTKACDMAAGPPLVPLSELDSAFQLQEHLAALHYSHTGSNTSPINRETAKLLATPPPATDRTLWLYELCRFLIEQCNSLIVGFLFDTPPCSAATCPEMRASEWQFLCAVHDQPKSCCAIDYCCHTLDWAANVVTNPQIFPSRFVALSDAHDKGAAVKNLVNVFRRLHRIFAHAWFQHRGVFWTVEGHTGLYVFFKTVCDLYDLLPGENYKLPPEAEGLEPISATPFSATTASSAAGHPHTPADSYQPQEPSHRQQQSGQLHPMAIARPPRNNSQGAGAGAAAAADVDDDSMNAANSRTNTRRHIRSSPSTGSAVTTVLEADEDETAADFANRLRDMHIVDPAAAEDELDAAEVPVIVEHGISVRRISGAGAGSGGGDFVPQTALPPIRIATPDHPAGLPAPGQQQPGASPTGTDAEAPAESGGPVATAPRIPKEGEETFLDSPDVETPVQGGGDQKAAKTEPGPEPPKTEFGKSENADDTETTKEEQKEDGSESDEEKRKDAAAAGPAHSEHEEPVDIEDEDETKTTTTQAASAPVNDLPSSPEPAKAGEGVKDDAASKETDEPEKAAAKDA